MSVCWWILIYACSLLCSHVYLDIPIPFLIAFLSVDKSYFCPSFYSVHGVRCCFEFCAPIICPYVETPSSFLCHEYFSGYQNVCIYEGIILMNSVCQLFMMICTFIFSYYCSWEIYKKYLLYFLLKLQIVMFTFPDED